LVLSVPLAHAGDRLPGDTPAVLVKRVPPRYPAKAIERGQEGWVALRFTITPEGTTSGIRVVAEHPRFVFDRTAINAVSKWKYKPRMESGVPVPQTNYNVVLAFALGESTEVRDRLVPVFNDARSAVRAGDWAEANQIMDELAQGENLTLFELACLEEIRGRLAFGRQDYLTAADAFARTLQMTKNFSPRARDQVAELLVTAAINSGEPSRALQAYDRWTPSPREENRDLRHAIAQIRAGLAAGRHIGPRRLPPPPDE
jgi:TonB family protein